MDRIEKILARQKEREAKMKEKEQANKVKASTTNNKVVEKTSNGLSAPSNMIIKSIDQMETEARKDVWKKDANGKWLVNGIPNPESSESTMYNENNNNNNDSNEIPAPPTEDIDKYIHEYNMRREINRSNNKTKQREYSDPFYAPYREPNPNNIHSFRTKEPLKHLTEEDAHREASKNRWKKTESGWQQLDSASFHPSNPRNSKWLVGISVPHSNLLSTKENSFYETPATYSSLPIRLYESLELTEVIQSSQIINPNSDTEEDECSNETFGDWEDFWWACKMLTVLIEQYFSSVYNSLTTHQKLFSDLQLVYTVSISQLNQHGEHSFRNRKILRTLKSLFEVSEMEQLRRIQNLVTTHKSEEKRLKEIAAWKEKVNEHVDEYLKPPFDINLSTLESVDYGTVFTTRDSVYDL